MYYIKKGGNENNHIILMSEESDKNDLITRVNEDYRLKYNNIKLNDGVNEQLYNDIMNIFINPNITINSKDFLGNKIERNGK